MVFANVVSSAKKAKAHGLVNLSSNCYIAMGRGSSSWNVDVTESKTFVANVVTLVPNVADVVVKSSNNAITYTKNVDYVVNDVQGLITRLSGGTIASGATVNVTYKVVGKVLLSQTDMVDEIGRRKASVNYVTPNANGSIELDGIKYNISNTPTDLILCKTKFVTGEAAGETVREFGLFFDTVLDGTAVEETLTFANSQIVLDNPKVRNVVVKDSTETTTFEEGVDYIVDYSGGIIFRIHTGTITTTQQVHVDYKIDETDYVEVADVSDIGLLFVATNFVAKDRDGQGDWTKTFLISLVE